jgi:hypothetical protein
MTSPLSVAGPRDRTMRMKPKTQPDNSPCAVVKGIDDTSANQRRHSDPRVPVEIDALKGNNGRSGAKCISPT